MFQSARAFRRARVEDASNAVVDRFRQLSMWLVGASTLIAIAMTMAFKVHVDPKGTYALEWLIAALLLASRVWWDRSDHRRMADACGAVGTVAVGGMACGAIAMLELRLGFPLADGALRRADLALGVDGVAIVDGLERTGHWIFSVLAPPYNLTIPAFFGSMLVLAWRGNRVEAWRAAFCFVGTLLTTCIIAAFVPAKGLGIWAPPALNARLPEHAMRTFWTHFDSFYFGADPVLRLQVVDGVISFPSFHCIVGFLVLAMWRRNPLTLAVASVWLVVMLVATLPGGGHYFVDLLAGFAVWLAWFALSRLIEYRTRPSTIA